MHGIFVGSLNPGEIRIEGEENRHIKVARIREGEKVFLTDGRGNFCVGVLREHGKNYSVVYCDEIKQAKRERTLYIAMSIIEQSRAEIAVEKGTELGVAGFIFFPSNRSQRKSVRLERLVRRAMEAVKQSKNPFLPEIKLFHSLEEAIKKLPPVEEKFFLHFGGEKPLKTDSAACFVGPEGGWTSEEVDMLEKRGFLMVDLGRAILRSETAAIAFASHFMLL